MKQLILTSIIAAAVSAATTWSIPRYFPLTEPASHPSEDVSEDEQDISQSEDDIKDLLLTFVGYKADEDEDNAEGTYSDKDIASMKTDAAVAFIQDADDFLGDQQHPAPELCFALGRVALLHGYTALAQKYLQISANAGYAAAFGYLGDKLLTANAQQQWGMYKKAMELGFAPASEWKEHLEVDAIDAIQRFTGDNMDPDLPKEVHGMSMARLMALNTSDIDAVIENYAFFAIQPESPRHLAYGLGRAAYLHQQIPTAKKFLELADQRGSCAAAAYLAYDEFTYDVDKKIELLQKAANGGFDPAKRRLEDLMDKRSRMPVAR